MGLWTYLADKLKPLLKDEIKAEVYAELLNSPDVVARIEASCNERIAQINSAGDTALSAITDRKTGIERTVRNLEAKAAESELHMKRSWADYKKDIDARLKEVESSNSQTVAKFKLYEAQASKLEEITQNAEQALAGLNEKITTEVKKVIDETNAETLKQEVEKLKAANTNFYKSIEVKVKSMRADLAKASSDFDANVSKANETVSALYSDLEAKLDEVYKSVCLLVHFMGFLDENLPHIFKYTFLSPEEKQMLIDLHDNYKDDANQMLHEKRAEISRMDSRNRQGLDTLPKRTALKQLEALFDYQNSHLDKEGEPISLYQIGAQLKAWGKYAPALEALKESLPKQSSPENAK